jgi:hypothetical protein
VVIVTSDGIVFLTSTGATAVWDTPYQLIGQFLREHPDVFCVDCLAEAIEASPGQVSMATQRLLAGEAAFAARLDVCSRCARRRIVIRAAA